MLCAIIDFLPTIRALNTHSEITSSNASFVLTVGYTFPIGLAPAGTTRVRPPLPIVVTFSCVVFSSLCSENSRREGSFPRIQLVHRCPCVHRPSNHSHLGSVSHASHLLSVIVVDPSFPSTLDIRRCNTHLRTVHHTPYKSLAQHQRRSFV